MYSTVERSGSSVTVACRKISNFHSCEDAIAKCWFSFEEREFVFPPAFLLDEILALKGLGLWIFAQVIWF